MAVYNGLIASWLFNGNDISEDVLTLGLNTPNGLIDISALDLIGMQRILGRVDASIQFTFRVSNAAAGAQATIKPATAAAVTGASVLTFTAGPVFTFTGIVENPSWAIDANLGLVGTATIQMSTGVAGAWS